jgi:hypothetical protein
MAQLVQALSYKADGTGLIPDDITDLNPSGHIMALGSIQPVTEIGTRNIS